MRLFPEANWPEWEIESEIGSGAFGKVYSIIRQEENGIIYRDALKVVNIPKARSEVEELYANGMDEASITEYFRSQAWHVFNEIHTLNQVGGITNIVNCKDHKMVPQENGVGYRIFIRMELLTPLTQYQNRVQMDLRRTVQMGIDIARALEACERHQIIHRDIKPANIFVSDNGDFKLGDFGIARNMDSRTVGTVAGTYTYMAPEIYGNRPYDLTADIYSLGVVLYQYLNKGHLPFIPLEKMQIFPQDIEQSFLRRMRGEPVPMIEGIPEAISAAVCQALAFNPGSRYRNASEFRRALEDAMAGTGPAVPRFCRQCGTRLNPQSLFCPKCGTPVASEEIYERTVVLPNTAGGGEEKKKRLLILLLSILGGLLALLIIAAVISGIIKGKKTVPETEEEARSERTSRTETEPADTDEESSAEPDETGGKAIDTKEAPETEKETEPAPAETEVPSETETEKETPEETEKETETVPEETKPVKSLESQVTGTWLGDLNSVIFLKEDGSCTYQEPCNVTNIRLRRGVQCRWSIYGSRLYIDNAGGYDLYADLENPVGSLRILSDNTSWNIETFRMLREGESLPAVSEKDCYLLPSDRRKLSDADLDALSQQEVKLARNEVFARHGRKFKDSTIRSYFEGKNWYSGKIDSAVFDQNMDSYLNDYEIYNYKFITDYENRHYKQ